MTTPYASESFLHQLLGKAVAAKASDVHLKVGQPPGARVQGNMVYFRVDKIRPEDTEAAAQVLIGDRQARDKLGTLHELGMAYAAPGLGRFRVHIYRQRGSLAIIMRSVPLTVPTIKDLGLPAAVQAMSEQKQGIVLIAGGAGSGRTSTLAAMIGHVNASFPKHIVTIEDPIEFMHDDGRSSVSQREVGTDTPSLHAGLASALRQDPDVIMVSDLRDEKALDLALHTAEMGRLVLSTLSAPDVAHVIRRLVTSPELRDRIAEALQGVVAQRLLPRQDGTGLVLVVEVLVVTAAVRESIRRPTAEGIAPIAELMEKGATTYGMQTFEMHLRQLASQGLLSKEILAML